MGNTFDYLDDIERRLNSTLARPVQTQAPVQNSWLDTLGEMLNSYWAWRAGGIRKDPQITDQGLQYDPNDLAAAGLGMGASGGIMGAVKSAFPAAVRSGVKWGYSGRGMHKKSPFEGVTNKDWVEGKSAANDAITELMGKFSRTGERLPPENPASGTWLPRAQSTLDMPAEQYARSAAGKPASQVGTKPSMVEASGRPAADITDEALSKAGITPEWLNKIPEPAAEAGTGISLGPAPKVKISQPPPLSTPEQDALAAEEVAKAFGVSPTYEEKIGRTVGNEAGKAYVPPKWEDRATSIWNQPAYNVLADLVNTYTPGAIKGIIKTYQDLPEAVKGYAALGTGAGVAGVGWAKNRPDNSKWTGGAEATQVVPQQQLREYVNPEQQRGIDEGIIPDPRTASKAPGVSLKSLWDEFIYDNFVRNIAPR